MPITLDDMTIKGFLATFAKIVKDKEAAGIQAIQKDPDDLLERAKSYGVGYKNGSWGWSSNVWSRSAAGSVIVESEDELAPEHRQLMLNVAEFILCRPMIQVDANLGSPGSRAEMRCRLFCDPQFPDIAFRWRELNFPGDPEAEPEAVLFCIPQYLENPNVPGKNEMLKVIRFPNHGYTIVTATSYQGEVKKGFLTHWIQHVYNCGGTGEHASLKEFVVKTGKGGSRRVVMGCWGLSGSGKSTHGLYAFTKKNAQRYVKEFGVNPLELVVEQDLKNDDITAWFADEVLSPELGAWTKTEDVGDDQEGIYKAAKSPRALHENTEWDEKGDVSFAGKLFQYRGMLNRNARTVLYLADTGYFDGNVDSTVPPNMAVFITPAYIADFAWIKLNDPLFASKVLADGRTTGHPAQSSKGVGEEKYETRYCMPFTMGVGNAAHVHRFCEFLEKRWEADDPLEVYQINTTGRIGAQYKWEEVTLGGRKLTVPRTVFETINGKKKPVGGTGPSIEETELFLLQAARGAVTYEPHPMWGEKVLVPTEVPGLPAKRLAELSPFSYRSADEMRKLLRAQIEVSKYFLSVQCPGLDARIVAAMDF